MGSRPAALWLLGACFMASAAKAQLVNIEARRLHSDSVRRMGEYNLNFSYRNINQKTFSVLGSNLVLQLKSKNFADYWLLLASADISKAGGRDFDNSAFLHLRYNHKMNGWLRWEAFQQYQRSLPIGIRWRYLAGTGPRFKLLGNATLHCYVGLLYMYEYEGTTEGARFSGGRSSSYATFTLHLPAIKMELTSTTYYQPLLRQFADYRILSENRLLFDITKKLKIQTSLRYFFDSRPPTGFSGYTLALEQGFGLRF
jgi:hypothetical protein